MLYAVLAFVQPSRSPQNTRFFRGAGGLCTFLDISIALWIYIHIEIVDMHIVSWT